MVFDECTIGSNSREGDGKHAGVFINAAVTRVFFRKCIITNDDKLGTGKQGYGIFANVPDVDVEIFDCDLRGNFTGAIGHPEFITGRVERNLGYEWKELIVPTNAGWTTSLLGSGGVSQNPFRIAPYTGTTANSRGLAYVATLGLNSGDRVRVACDYSKRLEWEFIICRRFSDSEAVARIQLKQVNTEGDLANVGIGLRIDNYTVLGEAYGTARQTVSLGTLTDDRIWRVKIVLIPNTRVEFWVDGVLRGSLTGTAVPTGVTATTWVVVSIINGPTGGVNATLYVGNLMFVQEW